MRGTAVLAGKQIGDCRCGRRPRRATLRWPVTSPPATSRCAALPTVDHWQWTIGYWLLATNSLRVMVCKSVNRLRAWSLVTK